MLRIVTIIITLLALQWTTVPNSQAVHCLGGRVLKGGVCVCPGEKDIPNYGLIEGQSTFGKYADKPRLCNINFADINDTSLANVALFDSGNYNYDSSYTDNFWIDRAGDLDKDGNEDFTVCDYRQLSGCKIYYGSPTILDNPINTKAKENVYTNTGSYLRGGRAIGDINNDGKEDFVVERSYYDYIAFGGSNLNGSAPYYYTMDDGSNGFRIDREYNLHPLYKMGDLTGDSNGSDDLLFSVKMRYSTTSTSTSATYLECEIGTPSTTTTPGTETCNGIKQITTTTCVADGNDYRFYVKGTAYGSSYLYGNSGGWGDTATNTTLYSDRYNSAPSSFDIYPNKTGVINSSYSRKITAVSDTIYECGISYYLGSSYFKAGTSGSAIYLKPGNCVRVQKIGSSGQNASNNPEACGPFAIAGSPMSYCNGVVSSTNYYCSKQRMVGSTTSNNVYAYGKSKTWLSNNGYMPYNCVTSSGTSTTTLTSPYSWKKCDQRTSTEINNSTGKTRTAGGGTTTSTSYTYKYEYFLLNGQSSRTSQTNLYRGNIGNSSNYGTYGTKVTFYGNTFDSRSVKVTPAGNITGSLPNAVLLKSSSYHYLYRKPTTSTRFSRLTMIYGANDVKSAGDFNQDGKDDLVIYDTNASIAGESSVDPVFILYGQSSYSDSSMSYSEYATNYAGTKGVTFLMPKRSNGTRYDVINVGSAGDANNDGIADIFITIGIYSSSTTSSNPKILIIKGQAGYNNSSVVDLNTDKSLIHAEMGLGTGSFRYVKTEGVGDIDKDGRDDILTSGFTPSGSYYRLKGGLITICK